MNVLLHFLFLIFGLSLQQIEAKNRIYYIAAVDVEWDYAPSGRNAKNGVLLDKDGLVK